jgi:hypothetical protein
MKKLKRRPKLAHDVLLLLEQKPNLTQSQIVIELVAKPHSVKAVLWKLLHQQQKIVATKGAKADKMTGPKVINMYSLKEL